MSIIGRKWAYIVYRYPIIICFIALIMTVFAINNITKLSLSTQIEALMPQGTRSVQTLNTALRKTGSFASIQIVATADDPDLAVDFLKDVKARIDTYDWVDNSQYLEDVEVLESRKLLLLNKQELLDLEMEVDTAYSTIVATRISEAVDAHVTFTLRDEGLRGTSDGVFDPDKLNSIDNNITGTPDKERYFQSDDGKTIVLVIWPKSGFESLADSKRLVDDTTSVRETVAANDKYTSVVSGVAGRIANKVAQFDAIINDLKTGLLTSIILIALLIGLSYRSLMSLPVILIPLFVGIIWTMGMTAITVGGLNLITVFLTLILFGLGVDFGIHNFSRYREERRSGETILASITTLMVSTGGASLIAALTTACAFFSLTLTEFRAFSEFGIIAGMGIVLTYCAMYSLLPAFLVLAERVGWAPKNMPNIGSASKPLSNRLNPLLFPRISFGLLLSILVFSVIFVPQMAFERNIKNLEAERPKELMVATEAVNRVFSDGHDRAIIVVEEQEDLVAIDKFFKDKILNDQATPTISKVSSLLDYVPDRAAQEERLEIIRRLERRADQLKGFDLDRYQSSKRYLSVADMNIADLPVALRRTYLGTNREPGYLMYVYNSVNMNDSEAARQFYDDAAQINLNDKTFFSAAEGFIFVEMIALMKTDAIRAILLVIFTTGLLILLFLRSFKAMLITLIPPLFGVLFTIGIMGLTGINLSIMNMVILPSLIGIAVDNSVHIYHRYEEDPEGNIAQVMNTTGRAAVITTLTTMIGFGGMVSASMGGLRSMGLLAIVGFLSCLLMTWVLLPHLMQRYAKAH